MKILKTKTFWVGLVTILFGGVQVAGGNQDSGIQTILIGFAIITGRQAISKIE
jgi:hypothetical protein